MATPKNRPNRAVKKRVPMNTKNRLTFTGLDPNYYHYVFNDSGDTIARAQEAGYEFVSSEETLGDVRVGTNAALPGAHVAQSVGGGTTGYLMRLPNEYYEEDQKAKADAILKTEKAMAPDPAKEQYGGLKTE